MGVSTWKGEEGGRMVVTATEESVGGLAAGQHGLGGEGYDPQAASAGADEAIDVDELRRVVGPG